MALTIQIRDDFWGTSHIPLEVDSVLVDRMLELSLDEIKRTLIWQGKTQLELGEAFDVSGDLADAQVVWHGDLSRVHWIGAKHRLGSMKVEGSVGRHLGSQMSGGELQVSGDAGDFVGCEMTGGKIRIVGNAGNRVGARYPGSVYGMNRGAIFVGGDAGKGLGENMRRGTIVVEGSAGDAVGWNMLAGTLCVIGDVGNHPGAGMVRGTIVCCGETPELLPTFARGHEEKDSVWMRIFGRWLERQDISLGPALLSRRYQQFAGDLLHGGRGEVWLAK